MRRGISSNAMRSLYSLATDKYALVHPTLRYDSDCTIRRKARKPLCCPSVYGDLPSLSVDARRLSFKSGNLKSAGNVGLTS